LGVKKGSGMRTLAFIVLTLSICYVMLSCIWAVVAWGTFTHVHWMTTVTAFAIAIGSLIIVVEKSK